MESDEVSKSKGVQLHDEMQKHLVIIEEVIPLL
jgi:hypothetical protein